MIALLHRFALAVCLLALPLVATAADTAPVAAEPAVDATESARLAAEVKAEFLHAWNGYKRHAWGHDDLAPLSRKPRDWYAAPLLMTPVDALDTLLLMGLTDEADAVRELIATRLDFDRDVYVKNFEITIRLLGGLLSGYQLSGDARLLAKAEDLGRRLLPVFDSPTGLPWVEVNLRNGRTRNPATNPAETGTLLLEFGTLSKLTGNPVYHDRAKRALRETYARRSPIGLVGSAIDVRDGRWLDRESHVSGGIDSYYEYLYKCWRLFGDRECLAMYQTSIDAVHRHLADEVDGALWYGYADMDSGRRTQTHYGALDAFFPALLALSGERARAARLQDSSMRMWNLHGIEPEVLDYRTMQVVHPGYALRPEIVESVYTLYRTTRDPKYLAMGRSLLRDFVRHCRSEAGYAALSDVVAKTQKDRMESFVLAETFKYFYLLFAGDALDFDAVTFNTEAHPLRATWAAPGPRDAAADIEPRIGTANGGNVFPGAVRPFGMFSFSPETTRGDHSRAAAPGGYAYDAKAIRGFSLTHLSGTGCRGASGDIPLLPVIGEPTRSPSSDAKDQWFAPRYAHANEVAEPGDYRVRLDNGVRVELGATPRTGSARLSWPAGSVATLLVRASDSQVGSSDAEVAIDVGNHRVSGSVTSGNFCGYLDAETRRSYYTLYFVAEFDRPIASHGTWHDATLTPGSTQARGGTGYGKDGYPPPGKGSGAWLRFDTRESATVNLRVGISYVSLANARENLMTENPPGTPIETLRAAARADWNDWLGRIGVEGTEETPRRIFRTALYHALLHPNLASDVNGDYAGFDGRVQRIDTSRQRAQYANFSGWDVYRSQVQLVTLLDRHVGSDVAQSLLNQARQSGGVWDRWTHNAGATHVMNGDPAAAAVAAIDAFGGDAFERRAAFDSLLRAATTPTALDGDKRGCPIECVGQRPGLAQSLALGYVPAQSHAWGAAAETLEQASADSALAAFAERLGETATAARLHARAGQWRNLFNPSATPHGGYLQNRNADGSWPAFDPASDDGFVEGSAAQYLWMVPFDARGLIDLLGGDAQASRRLDVFFHDEDGQWALTQLGGLHAEMDNEPSIAAPWLYLFIGEPHKTQATVRASMDLLWKATPDGIPGNDDLGQMSSWYVWSALGLYPLHPGRAELVVGSPRFARSVIHRGDADLVITAPAASSSTPYVTSLARDGEAHPRAWLPANFIARNGSLHFELSQQPDGDWARDAAAAPPSFGPPRAH